MKMAIITTYPPGKGSLNEYAYHFVRHLRDKPDLKAITLLVDHLPEGETYSLAESSNPENIPIQVIACWEFGRWDNAWRINKILHQVKPDVVLYNIQFASFGQGKIPAALGLLAPALSKLQGYPTITLLHNIMETVDLKSAGFSNNPLVEMAIRFFGNLMTRGLLLSDFVALTIPKYVEILIEKYKTEKVFLAPHGAFEDIPMPSFDLPEGPLQIMTFGKFGTYKKVEMLIEAFIKLQARHEQALELVIAGSNSPNAAGYLERVQTQYAQVPNIRYTGYVAEEDVPRIFQEAAVVVFPYTSTTGSSGVLHQAGTYGKAVVLPKLGDFAELIEEEGYIGQFFEANDKDNLAEAIDRILVDPAHRRNMGTQNYMASSGVKMEEVVDWYILHFENLLISQKKNSPSKNAHKNILKA